jgi:hypothetical protein
MSSSVNLSAKKGPSHPPVQSEARLALLSGRAGGGETTSTWNRQWVMGNDVARLQDRLTWPARSLPLL